jgi:hypothetical protein
MLRFRFDCTHFLALDNGVKCRRSPLDAVHEVRVTGGPLEGRIAAIGGARDGDEVFDAEPVE